MRVDASAVITARNRLDGQAKRRFEGHMECLVGVEVADLHALRNRWTTRILIEYLEEMKFAATQPHSPDTAAVAFISNPVHEVTASPAAIDFIQRHGDELALRRFALEAQTKRAGGDLTRVCMDPISSASLARPQWQRCVPYALVAISMRSQRGTALPEAINNLGKRPAPDSPPRPLVKHRETGKLVKKLSAFVLDTLGSGSQSQA
jgi:hypothetical protein